MTLAKLNRPKGRKQKGATMKTAILQIVQAPKYSNVKGGLKLEAEQQPCGNWIVSDKRFLLHIDSRDIERVTDSNCTAWAPSPFTLDNDGLPE
jgi:hypothetical protein